MSLRLGVLPVAVMLLLFGVLIAACSSDSDDGGNDGDGADATEPANGGDATEPADGGGGGGGSGNATLTVGDESWSFDDVFCAFTPEEAGNDRVSFTLAAFGETAEGVRIQLDATIQDKQEDGRYEGDGVSYTVTLDDVEDFENPAVGWSSLIDISESEPLIQVDGKNVTADTTFNNALTEDPFDGVPGTLRATCP